MDYDQIRDITAGVQREHPLPSFADLDSHSRRIIERKAAALGVSAEKYYADIVRGRAEKLDNDERLAEIARKAHRYGRG